MGGILERVRHGEVGFGVGNLIHNDNDDGHHYQKDKHPDVFVCGHLARHSLDDFGGKFCALSLGSELDNSQLGSRPHRQSSRRCFPAKQSEIKPIETTRGPEKAWEASKPA